MSRKIPRKFFLQYLFLIFAPSLGISQTKLPDNFKIGNLVELFNQDSLKVYFDCTGDITDKKCASYYRIGKIDSAIANFSGLFFDYNMNNRLYLKANLVNNNLEGYAYYYFTNGTISEEGNYKNNIRDGKWVYYYPNGKVQKIFDFQNGEPLVVEAYKKNGKPIVINGNGNFSTTFSNYKNCNYFETSGKITNGKMNGKWIYSNPNRSPFATEIYQDGNYIKSYGLNNEIFTKRQIKLTMFYPGENLNMVENLGDCNIFNITTIRYEKDDAYATFYPALQKELNKYASVPKSQWLIVGVNISDYNIVKELNIASSINDEQLENYIYNVIPKKIDWKKAMSNPKQKVFDIYFSILVMDRQIIVLPDYVKKMREE